MPHTFPSRLLLILALVALGSGAQACTKEASRPAPESAAPAAVPGDFEMIFGQGGGFTGQWEGFAIHASGAVLSWSGPMVEEASTSVGALSDSAMYELWSRIQGAEFFEQAIQETGNMTAFIELTAGGRNHRVSWVPSVEGFEQPGSPVDALYRYTLHLANRIAEP